MEKICFCFKKKPPEKVSSTPYLYVFSSNVGKYGPEKLWIRTHFTQCQTCNFIKKRLQHRCFPVKFEKLLRTPILKNIYLPTTASDRRWTVLWKKLMAKSCLADEKKCVWHGFEYASDSFTVSETVARRSSVKKVFLKISPNWQENTCARVSF